MLKSVSEECEDKKIFHCNTCEKSYTQRHNLNLHVKKKHPDQYEYSKNISQKVYAHGCSVCNKKFSHKKKLRYHLKTHSLERDEESQSQPPMHNVGNSSKLICPMCRAFSCSDGKEIRKHFERIHDIITISEELDFSSKEQFLEWKNVMEKTCSVQFRTRRSRETKEHITTYYICSRSGHYISKSNGKRHLKLQGSRRIDAYCPASITLKVDRNDGKCNIKFISTHVGHKCGELQNLSLTQCEREDIAKKIALKIPFDHILDEIRETVENSNLKRIHLVNKKDLFNVQHLYHLDHPPTWHPNDAISVETWIEKVVKGTDNCILFYKAQGHSLQNVPQFKEEDFILIIMTSSQRELLLKFGNNIICIDGTHGTNAYDFELHTLMVVDEIREGFPCAFLISNRSDQEVMSLFFSEIKTTVGVLSSKIFMSDMADSYFNAWCEVMGKPGKRLFCTWHVDKAWRKNINSKIKLPETRAAVYKQLRILLEELDVEAFQTMRNKFVEMHCSNPDMTEFLKYFEDYLMKCEYWAYCHRKHSGINTNMRIERMHRCIKYEYLHGKKVKRLDKSIIAIMRMVKNKLFEKLITDKKGKLCHSLVNLRSRHKTMEKMDKNLVTQEDNFYFVPSTTTGEIYKIEKINTSCSCSLKCDQCDICIHQYFCSCLDSAIKFNMCKHIHLVAQYLKTVSGEFSNVTNPGNDENSPFAPGNDENNLYIDTSEEDDRRTILKGLTNNASSTSKNDKDKLKNSFFTLFDSLEDDREMQVAKEIEGIFKAKLLAVRQTKDFPVNFNVRKDTKGRISPQRKLFSTVRKNRSKNNEKKLKRSEGSEKTSMTMCLLNMESRSLE